ncbi:ABC transporter permease [Bacillus marasmi]|uniref:ABC transporter permease n=1 Tax=Bacillus marasmi TaxID=1926279 RepID=UPI00164D0E3E|nr:ABC transporter permease [Bacillus marasmi]
MTFRQFAFNNVLRNKRVYIGHFLSSTFAVIIFFTFGLIAFHPALKGNITEVSSMMNTLGKGSFQVSQYIIYIFSVIFILYSVSSFLKKRKKEFGIMMILGLSPRQFNRLVFYENIIIGTAATIIGIGIGLIFSKLILLISASVLTLEKGLPFYFPTKAISITGIGFMVLFVLISLFTSKTIRVTKLVDLIKSEEKPKPAPKASILLSLIAMLLIGCGYAVVFYFAMYVNEMSQEEMFAYMGGTVALVVAGTYYFFTQLSVYALKAIKQSEKLFFKKTNILSVSELVYRIKDNSVTFFLVAVISAVAFTAIGTSSAVGEVLFNELDTTYAIEYESDIENKEEQEHIAKIKDELEKEKIPFTLVEMSFQTTKTYYQTMKVSEYNKNAKMLGFKPITLNNEDAVVVVKSSLSQQNPVKDSFVTLHDNEFKVAIQEVITNQYFESYRPVYVVNDSLYLKLVEKNSTDNNDSVSEQHRYGFLIEDWKETLTVSEKIKEQLYYDIKNPVYYVSFLSIQWQTINQLNGIFSILTVLVGIVFFVFASSFLYFRLFTDLEKDQEKFRMLSKIGLGKKELIKVVTREMGVLFFLPFMIAVIHSSIAYVALQQLVDRVVGPVSLTDNFLYVLASFLVFHLIYFFVMRKTYLRQIYSKVI